MEQAVHYAAAVMEDTAYVCTWLVGFGGKEGRSTKNTKAASKNIPIVV
jgi:hypothetical protein